jgi:hypothetical protein
MSRRLYATWLVGPAPPQVTRVTGISVEEAALEEAALLPQTFDREVVEPGEDEHPAKEDTFDWVHRSAGWFLPRKEWEDFLARMKSHPKQDDAQVQGAIKEAEHLLSQARNRVC